MDQTTQTNTSSAKNSLNKADIKEWIEQTLIYSVCIPTLLAFLLSIQKGLDFHTAVAAASIALVSALINLLIKYKAGN